MAVNDDKVLTVISDYQKRYGSIPSRMERTNAIAEYGAKAH